MTRTARICTITSPASSTGRRLTEAVCRKRKGTGQRQGDPPLRFFLGLCAGASRPLKSRNVEVRQEGGGHEAHHRRMAKSVRRVCGGGGVRCSGGRPGKTSHGEGGSHGNQGAYRDTVDGEDGGHIQGWRS